MPEQDIKRRASELLQKGRLSEAIQEYKALLEQSKRPNPAIVNLVGDIYIKQGDHAAGFSHFLRACKHYADEGLYHNGIAVGKKILRLDKDQTEVYGTLGDLYARQGLGMDAVKFLNEFARRKEEANEYPAALAAFAQACETLIDCPELNIAYGEMLERVDRGDEAADHFRRGAEIYADRGMTAQAEHWTNRARSVSGEDTTSEDGSEEAGVWDMMSLRDLDEKDQKPKTSSAPPASGGEPARRPASGVHPRSQWGVFDPGKKPAMPPPPPLPEAASAPIAATDLAPPTGIAPSPPCAEPPSGDGLDLEFTPPNPAVGDASRTSLALEPPLAQPAPPEAPADGASPAPWAEETPVPSETRAEEPPPTSSPPPEHLALHDGLTLDIELPDAPFRAVKGPTTYAEPESVERATSGIELDLPPEAPAPPAAPPAAPPTEGPSADDESQGVEDTRTPGGRQEKRVSLSSLPGIIMPPSAKKKSEDRPPRGPIRLPDPPPPARPPSYETTAAEPPATVMPTAEAPAAEVPTADAPAQPPPGATPESRSRSDESLVMTSFSGLYSKPEVPTDEPPTREQAIIIGDDTELVREGGDVNEVINDFREATSQILGEDDHQAHYDLGTTYLEMELFEEAASEFEMAAGGARFALVSQEMLGYCYLRQGHIERAVAELRKGLGLEGYEDRAKIGLFYNLGIACGVLGQDAEAIEAFRRVQALGPNFRDTKTRLERLAPHAD